MLQHGIIRPSTSPYASLVLLVKKKDGTWHFCVDYRHLNVVTMKNKHHLPIVDELIDELTSARWFSKLDFRSGYHQICISEQDTHKIEFKTHHGLYESLVLYSGGSRNDQTFFQTEAVTNNHQAPLSLYHSMYLRYTRPCLFITITRDPLLLILNYPQALKVKYNEKIFFY